MTSKVTEKTHWLIGLKKEYINIPRTTLSDQNFLFFLDETSILCSSCPMIIIAHFSCIVLTFSYQFFKKSLFLYLLFWSNPSCSNKTLMLEKLLGTKLMSINHISYCKFNRELDVRVDWSLTICLFVVSYWERMKEKVRELRKKRKEKKKKD